MQEVLDSPLEQMKLKKTSTYFENSIFQVFDIVLPRAENKNGKRKLLVIKQDYKKAH